MHKRIRLSRFQKAFGVWQDDPGGMIVKCAEADALRSSFPTMLGGLYTKEEIEHETPVAASAPIFKTPEPVQEAEVVEDAPKAPATVVSPPVVPVPKPRPVKAPVQPSTPPEVKEEPKMLSVLQVIQQRMASKQVTTEQIIKFLIEMGNISETTQTLEEVAIESPDVLDMLFNQFDDIIERIKANP